MVYIGRKGSDFVHVILGIGDFSCIPSGVCTLCNNNNVHILLAVCITMICCLEFFLCCRFFWSFHPFQGDMTTRGMLMLSDKFPHLAKKYLWRQVYSTVICSISISSIFMPSLFSYLDIVQPYSIHNLCVLQNQPR